MKKKKPALKKVSAASSTSTSSAKTSTKSSYHALPTHKIKSDLRMIGLFALVAVAAVIGVKYSGCFEQVKALLNF
jgi:hypothetical protein